MLHSCQWQMHVEIRPNQLNSIFMLLSLLLQIDTTGSATGIASQSIFDIILDGGPSQVLRLLAFNYCLRLLPFIYLLKGGLRLVRL